MLAVGNLAVVEINAADIAWRLRVAGYSQLAAAEETIALRGVCIGIEQLVSIAVLRVIHTPIPLPIVPRLVRGEVDGFVGGVQLLVAHNAHVLLLVGREVEIRRESVSIAIPPKEFGGENVFLYAVDGNGVLRLRLPRQGKHH